MDKKVLSKYLNMKKELETTKRILKRLKSKSDRVVDYAKDYKTGYPHNVSITGYDFVTSYKIDKYEEKKERLEKKIPEVLDEITRIIETIEDPLAKSIYEYRFIADMKFEEIAVKTNNTYDNVRQTYYRTLKKL